MSFRKLSRMSETDHILVTDAVAAAETVTDGEIVTIVTDLSDHYHDIANIWATLTAFFALSLVGLVPGFFTRSLDAAFGEWGNVFTPGEYITAIFIFMAAIWVGVWLALQWVPLRMTVTPKHIKQHRVRSRAICLFKVGAESRTRGRTGILIFLSMHEHRAEIVADKSIADKVPPEIWGDAMLSLISHVQAGEAGKGMAAAVTQVGAVLAEHFPPGKDNPNELPNRLIEI